jgi:hypothetical protein
MIYSVILKKIKILAMEIGRIQMTLADFINSNPNNYVSEERYDELKLKEEILHKQIEVLQELVIDFKYLGEK